MATFHSEGKMIAIRVLPELYHSMNMELSNINASDAVKYQDKNLNKEVLINCLLIAYLSRDKDVRRRLMRGTVKVLEKMMDNRDISTQEIDEARLHIPEIWDNPDINLQ